MQRVCAVLNNVLRRGATLPPHRRILFLHIPSLQACLTQVSQEVASTQGCHASLIVTTEDTLPSVARRAEGARQRRRAAVSALRDGRPDPARHRGPRRRPRRHRLCAARGARSDMAAYVA